MRPRFVSAVARALILGAILVAPSVGQGSTDQIGTMKLLNSQQGWAANRHSLFWTGDGGKSWRDITPRAGGPEEIRSVFFRDSARGWALIVRPDESRDKLAFDLAATNDSGGTWSIIPVTLPALDATSTRLSGDGRIDFIDFLHGWVDLGVVSSANFRLGILVVTSDGGKSWSFATASPGVFGTVRFANLRDGWLAGGPGDQELYVTHDSSESWQKVTLEAPLQGGVAAQAVYDQPPSFADSRHGFLPVTFLRTHDRETRLALFATADDGRSWHLEEALPIADEPSGAVPSTVAAGVWVAASQAKRISQIAIGKGHRLAGSSAAFADGSSILQLSFVTNDRGWALTSSGLFSTSDGGASWTEITPKASPSVDLEPQAATIDDSDAEATLISRPPSSSGAGTSIHLGFDECQAPGTPLQRAWRTSSPFFDIGIYIGGASRSCANTNLTSSWVTGAQSLGWGLMFCGLDRRRRVRVVALIRTATACTSHMSSVPTRHKPTRKAPPRAPARSKPLRT